MKKATTLGNLFLFLAPETYKALIESEEAMERDELTGNHSDIILRQLKLKYTDINLFPLNFLHDEEAISISDSETFSHLKQFVQDQTAFYEELTKMQNLREAQKLPRSKARKWQN